MVGDPDAAERVWRENLGHQARAGELAGALSHVEVDLERPPERPPAGGRDSLAVIFAVLLLGEVVPGPGMSAAWSARSVRIVSCSVTISGSRVRKTSRNTGRREPQSPRIPHVLSVTKRIPLTCSSSRGGNQRDINRSGDARPALSAPSARASPTAWSGLAQRNGDFFWALWGTFP